MVDILYIVGYGIVWALWRRCLGGWLGLRRSYIVSAIPFLLLPCLTYGVTGWLLISGLTAIYWTLGHNYESWLIWVRYPVSGGIYPILKRFWRSEWVLIPFIDGYTAVCELFIGFCFGCLIGALI